MAKKPAQSVPRSFEEALKELEQIISAVESGEVGLEQSLQQYERGNHLIHYCRSVLGRAEKQIEQLAKTPEGGLAATPLETESPDDSEPQAEQ